MSGFVSALQSDLDTLRAQGLRRRLREVDSPPSVQVQIEGRSLLNFASNDYLGLANHPVLKEAAVKAVEQYGAGAGASRLISGSLRVHHELEETLASFKGTEAALSFSSGYAAALGAIGALVGAGDTIVLDKLSHASLVDAARLSGATLRVFKHNDLDSLQKLLRWAEGKQSASSAARRPRALIVTESVFSMDGDLAPLREIVDLKERHGAWLMLDEAHATGLFGENRRGLAEAYELSDRVEVQMSTLGKAIGAAGGCICGSRALIEVLINRARSFIFSTAPVPAAAAAATAGLRLIASQEGEDRRARLWALVDQLKNGLIGLGWPLGVVRSAIIPLIVGEEEGAVRVADQLGERGFFTPAIRFPTVARNRARLRLTMTSEHQPAEVQALLEALSAVSTMLTPAPSV